MPYKHVAGGANPPAPTMFFEIWTGSSTVERGIENPSAGGATPPPSISCPRNSTDRVTAF